MTRLSIWHGTVEEMQTLADIIVQNCDGSDHPGHPCGSHALLAMDQANLDRLLFLRRISDRLWAEESTG